MQRPGSKHPAEYIHIFFLCNLAIALPLLDLFSRKPTFFVARQSEPIDILLLVLFLSFIIPALIILLEFFTSFSKIFRRNVHSLFLFCLSLILVLSMLRRLDALPATILVMLSAIVASSFTIIDRKYRPCRDRFSSLILMLVAIVVPLMFLFSPPILNLLYSEPYVEVTKSHTSVTTPVVMVVFDEFPVTSLMDENRQIDRTRYPNFAQLSDHSHWYRNATTVNGSTAESIPAMLTGKLPDIKRLPTAEDYPNNIFSLLANSHDLVVVESLTHLCPETLCGVSRLHPSFNYRLNSLLMDLLIIFPHLVLPQGLTLQLPPITATWSDFAASNSLDDEFLGHKNTVDQNLDRLFQDFIASIVPSKRPGFYFLHVFLPHVPWSYLPSGKQYLRVRDVGLEGWLQATESWSENQHLVDLGFQRHLLQVGFVDKLLGQLFYRMKTKNLFDKSLIIITADHGVSFYAGDSRRGATAGAYQDIMSIPLFVKQPFQIEPSLTDRNVESIDILPTIIDVLDISPAWAMDGHSVFGSEPAREMKTYRWVDSSGPHEKLVESKLERKYKTLDHKIDSLGHSKFPVLLGKSEGLLGRSVGDLKPGFQQDISVSLENEVEFIHVDLNSMFVPAYISGELIGANVPESGDLAVAVNGIVRAIPEIFKDDIGLRRFACIVPEDSFIQGRNLVEVFLVKQAVNGDFSMVLLNGNGVDKLDFP